MPRVRTFDLSDLGDYLDWERKKILRRRLRVAKVVETTRQTVAVQVSTRAVCSAVAQCINRNITEP